MPDLKVIDGGGIKVTEDFMNLVECGECEGALFNWRINEAGDKHLIGCAICGSIYPIIEAEADK